MSNLRKQWNDSCLAADIPSLSTETCAMIMAAIDATGENEQFVMNKKFQADVKYIQDRFHIHGGESPDVDFCKEFKQQRCKIIDSIRLFQEYPKEIISLFKDYYKIELR